MAVDNVLPSCEMAEEALEKIEEQVVNCSICLDTYTDPKLLQCFHVFCQQCLVRVKDKQQDTQNSIACPTCRQATPITARGVAGLQPAFYINKLLEILKGAAPADLNPVKKISHCLAHEDKELELYCETCGELVCYKCVTMGEHYSHDYEEINAAFEKYKEEITPLLEPMQKQVELLKDGLALIDQHCIVISDQQVTLEDDIHTTFRKLRETLIIRETELVSQLHKMTWDKLKSLAAQSDKIEITLTKMNRYLHFVRESIKEGNEGDVLMMKKTAVYQVQELTTSIQKDTVKPNTEADMVFLALAGLDATCQDYGQVFAPGLPDPSKCYVTSEGGFKMAVVGEKSTVILHAINYGRKPCEESIGSLKCELLSEITGTRANCSVARRGQSEYEISYQPTVKGRHRLHIQVEGQYVRGSPSRAPVKSSVEKLGTPILTLGEMRGPHGVAINQRGEVVVTEVSGHCVSVFTYRGKRIRSFGSGQGQFTLPNGVAVDDKGNILVTDSHNHHIQKFTADGQFLEALLTKGNGALQFNNPTDITFNARNDKVYVVDSKNNRVQVLNSDLTFFGTFGKYGNGKGQFSFPWGIACDSTGKVYVADTGNHRIQVFTGEGKFVRMFGRHGQRKGELAGPCCVAVDTSGMVYISEGGNHRVSVFTSEGQYLVSFGTKGIEEGEFNSPLGLAVDKYGVVYVCDCNNTRIQVF